MRLDPITVKGNDMAFLERIRVDHATREVVLYERHDPDTPSFRIPFDLLVEEGIEARIGSHGSFVTLELATQRFENANEVIR